MPVILFVKPGSGSMITASDPCGAIRRIQQSLHLLDRQELDITFNEAFTRHAQYFLTVIHIGWFMQCDKLEEGPNSSKTRVPVPGGILSGSFDIIQKSANHFGIQVINA
jgi:hypothetical protein